MPAVAQHVPRRPGPWTPPSFGVAKGAPPTPIPLTIAGLVSWHDASQLGGLVNGSPVSLWPDLSPSTGANLSAAGSARPTYTANVANGLPVVRFDGAANTMAGASFGLAQPNQVFIVYAFTNAYTADGAIFDGLTGFVMYSSRKSATTIGMYAGGTEAVFTVNTPQSFHQYSYLYNGTSSECHQDGVLKTGAISIGSTNGSGLTLGSSAAPSFFAAVDIAEVITYNATLSAGDRNAIEQYLTNKWIVSGPASFVVTASDSVTFADSAARAAVAFARTATDSATFAESIARTVSDTRTASDSVTFAESLARIAGKTRAIVDSVTFSESLTRTSLGLTRTATDSLTFSESLARTVSNTRAVGDSITFSESIASGRSISRTGTDSLTFAESLTRGASAHTRSPADSITFSETLTRGAQSFPRTNSDSVTFSESLASGKAINRTATDSVTFAEALTRGASAHSRTPVDSFTFSESVARTQSLTGRSAADSVTFSESVASSKSISRTSADSVTFSESLASIVGRTRTAADSVTFSDSLTRATQTFTRAGVDSVTFTELLSSVASTQPGTRWKMGPSGRWPASAGTRWPGDTSPRWDGATGTRWQPGGTTRWS